MKKFATVMLVLATLVGNVAHAQNNNGQKGMNMNNGEQKAYAVKSAQMTGENSFAWGPAIGGLIVLGVIVGVTAAAASSHQSSYSTACP